MQIMSCVTLCRVVSNTGIIHNLFWRNIPTRAQTEKSSKVFLSAKRQDNLTAVIRAKKLQSFAAINEMTIIILKLNHLSVVRNIY